MAKNMPGKKPKNLKYTLGRLAFYFKKHLPLLLLIVLLIAVSALASVLGTYLL